MPQVIADDGRMLTVQTDDGRIVQMAKSALEPSTIEGMNPSINNLESLASPEPIASQMPSLTPDQLAMNNQYGVFSPYSEDKMRQRVAQEAVANQSDLSNLGVYSKAFSKLSDQEKSNFINQNRAQKQLSVGPSRDLMSQQQPAEQAIVEAPLNKSVEDQPKQQAKSAPSEIDQAFGSLNKAAQLGRDAGVKQAQAEEAYYKTKQDLDVQAAQEFQDREQRRQQLVQESGLKLDQIRSQLEQANVKDPFADSGTGTKLSAAVAVGLGALGAAMTGGHNYAMDIIDKAIDRDVQLQLKNIGLKQNQLDNQRSYLKDINDNFATDDQKASALKALQYNSLENKLKEMGAQNNQLLANANYQQMIGTVGIQKNKHFLEVANSQADIAMKTSKVLSDMQNPMGLKTEQIVAGLGSAYSAEDAKELRGLKGDVEGANRGIDTLLELSKKTGKSISPDDIATATTTAAFMQGLLRTPLVGPGTVSDSDRKILESVIANPTKVFSMDSSTRAALNTLRRSLESKLDTKAQSSIIDYKPGSYKMPEIKTIQGGAQFQVVNGRYIPVNDLARQIQAIEQSKGQK